MTRVQIAIVGAGPGGLSCAAHAAELGLSHVLLEAEGHIAHTIHQYQKGKHVMAEPTVLPARSPLPFQAGTREALLRLWDESVLAHRVDIRYRSKVEAIAGSKGDFMLRTAAGETHRAEHVVLCIGLQGNLRKLDVAGKDLDIVQYQLDDPEAWSDEVIAVVGAGDAAVENALALAKRNRVVLINRNDGFPRIKQGNLDLVLAAVAAGTIDCRYGTSPTGVERDEAGERRGRLLVQTPTGSDAIACDRVIARLGAVPPRRLVESFGVRFRSADAAATPAISEMYESSVPGLYVIGALGGYPLIKQALNQGYEVVEYIRGNRIAPADEPLLERKLGCLGQARVAQALALIQRSVPLFTDMSALQLREFMLESDVLAPPIDHIVLRQGDYSNFFSIVAGECHIEGIDDAGRTRRATLCQGQFFGEMGLLSGRRSTATVRAGAGCILIETPRRTMLKLIGTVEPVRHELDLASVRNVIRAHIASWIPDPELERIVQAATIKRFAAGDTLFSEGDDPDGLHVVRRGSVMVSRSIGGKEVVLAYVPAGNYVGEMALLSKAKRMATVRASVATETILLPATAVSKVLGRHEELREGMQALALQRITEVVEREARPDQGNLVSFLLEQGLGEATDVLLVDEALCIRCDNCEKACADTHDGTSRLDRDAGPTFANIHVPTSCRHCENPHCMKDCPPDAIHRNREGEVFIADTCIGCGNCERNCPYGVIQLAPDNPRRRRPSLITWLLSGLTPEPGREPPRAGGGDAKKAVKCDMCKDLGGGPACVRACPTGAAIRVGPQAFLDYWMAQTR